MNRSTPISRHAARLQLAANRLREKPQAGRNTAARFADALDRMTADTVLMVGTCRVVWEHGLEERPTSAFRA